MQQRFWSPYSSRVPEDQAFATVSGGAASQQQQPQLKHHHNRASADELPVYDPRSSTGKKEGSSRSVEKWVHAIPVIVFFCLFVLWWFSVSVKVAESVFDRFLGERARCASDDGGEEVLGSASAGNEHQDLESSREEVKEGSDVMDEEKGSLWWEKPIEEGLELPELKKYKSLLERLRENAAIKLDEMNRRELCTKDYLGLNFEIGSSSSTPADEEMYESNGSVGNFGF